MAGITHINTYYLTHMEVEKRLKEVCVKLTLEQINALAEIQKAMGLNRSEVIRRAVNKYIELWRNGSIKSEDEILYEKMLKQQLYQNRKPPEKRSVRQCRHSTLVALRRALEAMEVNCATIKELEKIVQLNDATISKCVKISLGDSVTYIEFDGRIVAICKDSSNIYINIRRNSEIYRVTLDKIEKIVMSVASTAKSKIFSVNSNRVRALLGVPPTPHAGIATNALLDIVCAKYNCVKVRMKRHYKYIFNKEELLK